jgi:hypothetical protein
MALLNIPHFFGPFNNAGENIINAFSAQWGIFNAEGEPFTGLGLNFLGATQSTQDITYNKIMNISNFPIQQGGFASYNKVELPGIASVTLNLSGSLSDRTQFINQIDAATRSTQLLSVITPEVQYINQSIERYSYTRSGNNNVSMLSVTLFMKEIRQVSARFRNSNNQINNPTNPNTSNTVNGGSVQGRTPTNRTQNTINSGL